MARRKTPETEPLVDPVEEPVVAAEPTANQPAPDPVAERAPESSPPPAPAALTPPKARRSGVLGPLLGGALAAIGGFALSHFDVLGLAAPDVSAELGGLKADLGRLAEADTALAADQARALEALEASLDQMQGRLAALEAAPAPEIPDLSRIDALDARLAAIEAVPEGGEASTAALAAKLSELERRLAARPAGIDKAEVDAALARLAAAEAKAAQRAEEAAAATAAAARAAGLDRLRAAVEGGSGFRAELDALGDPALTGVLGPYAAGVATLADLQAAFPDAARQTLQLARDASEERGWGARLVDFLAAQTGARSLTPREGDGPDAILSRAEFALSEGRLTDAVAELGSLDEGLRAPFADWIARAEARLAVDAALEGL
jgi:hypothetical protein